MKLKIDKRTAMGILVIAISMVISIVTVHGVINMSPRRALNNFVRQIERGNINDITLTIYWSNVFSPVRFSVRDLIHQSTTIRIVVDGSQLAEHIDLLRTIKDVTLAPVERRSLIDARIHYVFRNARGRRIFDIAMWGGAADYDGLFFTDGVFIASIFINGVEFKLDETFYDIIRPFLPRRRS